ncbi:MAG: hypothetical protein JO233_05905, partial [Candidatus Eremiobacteraeota bacterium]|nr:hypothetical protein [Candidatus Eremiobacteraeota bacterium]
TYVQPDGYELDRFAPGPRDDGIAWLGTSQTFWDTTWSESMQARLQRRLEATLYKGSARRPRVIPMGFPGASDIGAVASAIQTYFTSGMVKAVILELDEGFHTPPDQQVSVLKSIDDALRARHVAFIVLLAPTPWTFSPTESLAFQSEMFESIPFSYAYKDLSAQSYDTLLSIVKAAGVHYYDSKPEFEAAERMGRGPLFGTLDPHFTLEGRAVLAESAMRALERYFYNGRSAAVALPTRGKP